MTEIALLTRKLFPDFSWEHETLSSPHKNYLTMECSGRRTVVPFTNLEVRGHSTVLRVRALDHQMYAALRKLLED